MMRSLENPLVFQLWQTVAEKVSPDSLAVERSRVVSSEQIQRLAPRKTVLQPGDLILVRTPGTFYEFFRRLSRQPYDHVSIMMDSNLFLHIGSFI